jgi:predicted TIM-barrel fold metal-dependent hydrolase
MSRVIDTHLHLSPVVSHDAKLAARSLADDLAASQVRRGVVLHLQAQRWSREEFAEALAGQPLLRGLVNLNPDDADAGRQLREAVEKLGYIGLKLHPRLQRFDMTSKQTRSLVALAGEIGVPVLIDAFPDGDWLRMGFSPLAFADLAEACPQTRIVVAHFGGHHCLDLMMLAKRLPNMWFDLSFSLLYYAGSPVVGNLMYCCRSMKFRRIMYGSDYPDRPVGLSLQRSLETFSEAGISEEEVDALAWKNAVECFGWTDL